MIIRDVLQQIFKDLDKWVTDENKRRRKDGEIILQKCDIRLLGQMSLLANEKIAAILDLVGTRDVDAHLVNMEYSIKRKLVELLASQKLVYDEDSEKVWLPPGAKFSVFFRCNNFEVFILDPESALVSKAVKAKEKNKQLILDAISSEKFPTLIDRIEANGGDLNYFLVRI